MYTYTDNLIPIMTSMTTPSGRAFSSSYATSGNNADKAFDNSDVYGYVSGNGSVGHIGYEFVNPVRIGKYIVRSLSATYFPHMPKNWTFEGSDDGMNWTVLDTQINQTWTTVNTDKEYIIDYSKAKRFKMYRLNWTANNGGPQVVINELKMFGVAYFDKFMISTEDGVNRIIPSSIISKTPKMTSDTTPAPYIAKASSVGHIAYSAYKAFTSNYGSAANEADSWLSGGKIGWISIDLVTPQYVTDYALHVRNQMGTSIPSQMAKNWTFEGSNDGTNWTVLDTQVNVTGWVAAERRSFKLSKPVTYRHYRLNVTDNNGDASLYIGEIEIYETINQSLKTVSVKKEANFISHGMEKSTVIDLSVSMIKRAFVEQNYTTIGSGKVFKQKIDRSKHRANKIILG
ncbi:discoidin domain-containing protein [Paenibacillus sp. LK1]|uniref:discoidin domain-containing protein n=1 Tax=Paenibacillus sp. LK1 TaxID=2053014 RepID=UPI000C19EACD|nr:discoidin domain-containing protein [Paenibacillus sp. LK1]PIH59771.1 hypothetical protein CS562_07480 [Paenibacillus sp. LK1]